jgi:hypothetical protein
LEEREKREWVRARACARACVRVRGGGASRSGKRLGEKERGGRGEGGKASKSPSTKMSSSSEAPFSSRERTFSLGITCALSVSCLSVSRRSLARGTVSRGMHAPVGAGGALSDRRRRGGQSAISSSCER